MSAYAVFGAGAIGGFVGAMLARAGHDVTLIARGPHGAAMRAHGLTIESEDTQFTVAPAIAPGLPANARFDAVLIALKAHQIAAAAPQIAAALPAGTPAVFMQNGIPWWYFLGTGAAPLQSVDPGGAIAAAFAPENVVGCVVFAACEVLEPGRIRHGIGKRFTLGEPLGGPSARLERLASDFSHAGLKAPIDPAIRREVWSKLLGNAAFNPISALTRAITSEMLEDPAVLALVRQVMEETSAVAAALGVEIGMAIDERIAGARRYGDNKTSMLQDLLAGRPLELDPLVGAIVELGERAGVATPALRHVHALAALLDVNARRGAALARA